MRKSKKTPAEREERKARKLAWKKAAAEKFPDDLAAQQHYYRSQAAKYRVQLRARERSGTASALQQYEEFAQRQPGYSAGPQTITERIAETVWHDDPAAAKRWVSKQEWLARPETKEAQRKWAIERAAERAELRIVVEAEKHQ